MKKIIFILFFLGLFCNSYAKSDEVLSFAAIANTSNQIVGAKLLKDIYAKLNKKLNIEYLPGARASIESNKGTLAGEVLRIYSYGEHFPNLIRIDPEIYYIEPTAFVKNKNLKIDSWSSLKNYRVGIIRGFLWLDAGVKDVSNVTRVNSIDQLVLMVNLDRIDLFISDKLNGLITLKKLKMGDKIQALPNTSFERIKLYHYIHKKYKYLVPQIIKVVKEMKGSGELEALTIKYRDEVMKN
ncbi:substrate-binding periplasmic protein [Silvanigrella aquatica]|uniref:Uncharacterized protein n=1 Tax=Silvanigrella aquatica TaxID=1915309 RepID=A0A1L4CYQ0_9BACT|nr:transporter substrate-binding domain-containing protein [Silvanigrella aquatica]APJ03076.1 hypothetical protein AXG55_03785 [Silvanigrella aquatica]